jgi:hypothetical protein
MYVCIPARRAIPWMMMVEEISGQTWKKRIIVISVLFLLLLASSAVVVIIEFYKYIHVCIVRRKILKKKRINLIVGKFNQKISIPTPATTCIPCN